MTTPTTTPQAATPTSAAPRRGQFVWHDYMSPDAGKAHAFYQAVFGWGSEEWKDAGYRMWTASGAPRGGYALLPAELQSEGIPPHWLSYISVPDVDASAAEATAMGATIVAGPEEVPDVGRLTVLADPQGAVFSIFTSTAGEATDDRAPVGDMSWHELWTTDNAAAYDFYTKLFGWESAGEFSDPQIGVYRMFGRNGVPLGGMATILPQMEGMPPNWLPYVRVTDLEAAVERVKANGGQVIVGPMEVPGGDRVAQCIDALGGAFAMHQAA